jgi:hypothetical protein
MIRIIYDRNGVAISDFYLEEWYQAIRNHKEVYISTVNTITRFRVGVVEGDLSCDDVEFQNGIRGIIYNVNRFGAFSPEDYPNWLGEPGRLSERLLRAAVARRKAEVKAAAMPWSSDSERVVFAKRVMDKAVQCDLDSNLKIARIKAVQRIILDIELRVAKVIVENVFDDNGYGAVREGGQDGGNTGT